MRESIEYFFAGMVPHEERSCENCVLRGDKTICLTAKIGGVPKKPCTKWDGGVITRLEKK